MLMCYVSSLLCHPCSPVFSYGQPCSHMSLSVPVSFYAGMGSMIFVDDVSVSFMFFAFFAGSRGLNLSDFEVDDGHDGEPDQVEELENQSHVI